MFRGVLTPLLRSLAFKNTPKTRFTLTRLNSHYTSMSKRAAEVSATEHVEKKARTNADSSETTSQASKKPRKSGQASPKQSSAAEPALNLWPTMRISKPDHLSEQRLTCPKCFHPRAYFCPVCKIPLAPADDASAGDLPPKVGTKRKAATDTEDKHVKGKDAKDSKGKAESKSSLPLARVQLPVKPFRLPLNVHIIHHPKEKLQKSTAVHGVVLCPEQVSMSEYPAIPDFDPQSTVLLFPAEDAPSVSEIDVSQVKTAVFVDSTWRHAPSVVANPKLQQLRKVRINHYETQFWRFQTGQPKSCLATLEAVYYFCREFWCKQNPGKDYSGEFDDLLFYFHMLYCRIQAHYAADSGRTFTSRHYSDYIKSGKPAAAADGDADDDGASSSSSAAGRSDASS